MNKRTPIYSTSDTAQERPNIYLGNLKKLSKRNGKEILVGNVLLDHFLDIPEEFLSVSKKSGKKVIRILINENKDGVDMNGCTYNIRLDTYSPNTEASIVPLVKNEQVLLNPPYNKPSVTEEDIDHQDDSNVLLNWRIELQEELNNIKSLIKEAKIKAFKGLYSDDQWFSQITLDKNLFGTLIQKIQNRLALLKKTNRVEESDFIRIAKEELPPKTFKYILNKAKECKIASK